MSRKVRASWLLMSTVFCLVACASSKAPSTDGPPIVWQAFYYHSLNVVDINTSSGRCGIEGRAAEAATTVVVIGEPAKVIAGHGSCGSALFANRITLRAPVGSRSVTASPTSGQGMVFDIASRLHPPIDATTGLPALAYATNGNGGWKWTLGFPRSASKQIYLLVSTPTTNPDLPGSGPVRGHPSLTPCDGVICWREGGVDYSIDRYRPTDPAIADAEALAIAVSLVTG